MKKTLELIAKILIGGSFFVPLIVSPSSFIFPFIVPKILWFRSISLVLLGIFLVLLFSNAKKYWPKKDPLATAIVLFFISFSISTFVGVDWYRSFWDNHERMLGLFTIFHYVAYYLAIASIVKKESDWQWLHRAFLFAGSIVMFIGVMQVFKPTLLLNRGSRVASTLGNSIYVGGYGMFLLFLSITAFTREKLKSWKYFYGLTGLLGIAGVLFSGTRGTVVGLGVATIILGGMFLLTKKNVYPKAWKIVLAIALLGTIVTGLLFTFRQTEFVSNIPAIGRTVNTKVFAGSSNTRLMAWSLAVDAWKEKPLFGWGPNNYYYAFNKHYNPEFLRHGFGETWFDNAHNVVMNTLAVQGIFGIAAYISMFVMAGYLAMHMRRRERISLAESYAIIGFLIAHFVHNFFVFENPTSYMYFFYFMAYISVRYMNTLPEREGNQKVVSIPAIVVVGCFVGLFMFATNVNAGRANNMTLEAIKNYSNPQGDPVGVYTNAKEIPSPHIDDIRNDFARTGTDVVNRTLNNKKLDPQQRHANATIVYNMIFSTAEADLKINKELHPLDIRINIYLGQLYELGAQLSRDSSLLQQAELEYLEAIEHSPKRQQLYFSLANVQGMQGKVQEAAQNLEKAISFDDYIGHGWWRLALLYAQVGQTDKAIEIANNLNEGDYKIDKEGQRVIKQILNLNSVQIEAVSSTPSSSENVAQ